MSRSLSFAPIQKSSPFLSVRKVTKLLLTQTFHNIVYCFLVSNVLYILPDDWVWESDKSKLLIRDWHDGGPSKDGDCTEIKWFRSRYRWNDKICSHFNLYICEK
jgi:hypothetical protein